MGRETIYHTDEGQQGL